MRGTGCHLLSGSLDQLGGGLVRVYTAAIKKGLAMSIEKKSLIAKRAETRKVSVKKNKPHSTKVSSTKLIVTRGGGGGTIKVT